jgi:hypothetical protein
MLVRIFTTVFEFQNRNIYLLLLDTEASCQRYEAEQGSIHARGVLHVGIRYSHWLSPGARFQPKLSTSIYVLGQQLFLWVAQTRLTLRSEYPRAGGSATNRLYFVPNRK